MNIKQILPIAFLAGAFLVLPGCAATQTHVETSTHEVVNDTGTTVGSVLNGVGSIVMWPFHVVADVL